MGVFYYYLSSLSWLFSSGDYLQNLPFSRVLDTNTEGPIPCYPVLGAM